MKWKIDPSASGGMSAEVRGYLSLNEPYSINPKTQISSPNLNLTAHYEHHHLNIDQKVPEPEQKVLFNLPLGSIIQEVGLITPGSAGLSKYQFY